VISISRKTRGGRPLLLMILGVSAVALAAVQAWAARAQTQQKQPAPQAQPEQPAQSQSPQPKLKVESKLVYVNAVVRDKKGKIVSTLNKEDFKLDEDGRPQTITNFIRESDLPLTLGLLVDTSMSQRAVLNSERDASYTFLDQMLRPDKDKAFVIHFDHEVELLRDLTSDREKLKSALGELQIASYEQASDSGDDNGGQRGGRHHGGGTQLYDAVYLASNELMKKQQGRKAIFVLSDGVDRGSKETLEDAVEAAQRADTSVYSIYFASEEPNEGGEHRGGWHMGGPGMGYPGGGYPGGGYPGGGGRQTSREARPDGKKVLERISTQTGGRLFQISKKQTISDIYAQVEEELRNQYTLGYAPDRQGAAAGGDYHKIHLTTQHADLVVQARDGYYSD
jgi:VWFA-related protein